METPTREISTKEKLMVKASTIGPTEKSTTVSGSAESRKATECGEAFSVIVTWASGRIAKRMDRVCISGKTAIDMRVAGTTASNTEEAPTSSPTVTYTMENTYRANLKAKEYTNGKTGRYIQVNSKMVSSMDAVSGEKYLIIRNATDSRVNTSLTKRTDKVLSHGRVAISIMGIMSMMREWATVKCIGPMAPYTKVNGIRVYSMDVVL